MYYWSRKYRSMVLWLLATVCLFMAPRLPRADANDTFKSLKTIRILPRTQSELEMAHERSRGNACESLGSALPIELSSFALNLSKRDARDKLSQDPATRRTVFTVGLTMLKEDQARLPSLSGGQIMKYLNEHHVAIQARIQKDHDSGQMYLHHRPFAATVTFGGARLTQEFQETVSEAVNDFHSLGLYMRPRSELVPANLRTLVLVHRNRLTSSDPATGDKRVRPIYELAFVRAVSDPKTPDRINLHSFVTTDQCRTLHLVSSSVRPGRPEDCTLRGSIVFTSFQNGQLYPKDSALRRIFVKSKSKFSLATLDKFAQSQEWKGDAWDNLNETLDAMIEGRVRQ